MHLYESLPKPVVFGHRGASQYAPENTMAAFDLAVKQGAPAIELDTMLTKDGVPIVIHDHTLERTTNGSGEIGQKTAHEIRELDAGSHFSPDFRDEKVPLLEEVLERFRDGILINIELKNYHTPGDRLAGIVYEMVGDHGLCDRVIFSSFLPRNLRILRSLGAETKTALLTPGGIAGAFFRSFIFRGFSPEFIHPAAEDVSREYIEKEHQQDRCVNTWTVDDPKIAQQLIDWGIDGIITNDPWGILALLK